MDGVGELDVVIPTRDRPRQLTACLIALADQKFDRFGVIVVDDAGSTPASDLLPNELLRRLRITFVRNDTSIGAGACRNRGVAASDAAHLVFLDDDCIACAELIGRHRAALAVNDPVVSLGPILSPPGQRMPAWTHWDADRLEREYDLLTTGRR